MRFTVESWSTEYGTPFEAEEEADKDCRPDVAIEVAADAWRPLTPRQPPATSAVFVDGVQQIDARVWVTDDAGSSRMGVCVSYAAGSVRCSDSATIESVEVRRKALGPASLGDIDCGAGVLYRGMPVADPSPRALDSAIRRQREDLEVEVAHAAGPADLVLVDGHVRQRETIPSAAGYLKSHQAQYLQAEQLSVIGRLAAGQRTPLFLLDMPWSRYSWYLRLPGGQGHAWAGVVRCEASSSLRPAEAIEFADFVSATLPRFASQQHKDPRAPQNLYPVAGLERELRRRMGESALLLRSLRRASHLS